MSIIYCLISMEYIFGSTHVWTPPNKYGYDASPLQAKNVTPSLLSLKKNKTFQTVTNSWIYFFVVRYFSLISVAVLSFTVYPVSSPRLFSLFIFHLACRSADTEVNMRVFDLFPTAWALALAQSLQPYICPFICFMLTSQLSGHLKMSNRAICVEDWPAIDQLIYYYLSSASPPRPALYNWRVYLMMIKETGPFGAFKIIHIHLCVCVCVWSSSHTLDYPVNDSVLQALSEQTAKNHRCKQRKMHCKLYVTFRSISLFHFTHCVV